MIKARHHWFYTKFFRWYIPFMLNRHFRRVIIKGDIRGHSRPVLLVGNHFSWWDGFFAHHLNKQVFKRRFHVMMLEEQLQSRMFLNKAGAYSIRKNSPSVIETIQYTRELLRNPDNLVTLFPQGEIRSMFDFPVRFEKGPVRMLRGMEDKVQIVFMAALVDYFSHPKPTLTLALGEYHPRGGVSLEDMEKAFNDHLRQMIHEQKP